MPTVGSMPLTSTACSDSTMSTMRSIWPVIASTSSGERWMRESFSRCAITSRLIFDMGLLQRPHGSVVHEELALAAGVEDDCHACLVATAFHAPHNSCLLYTSDAADERSS